MKARMSILIIILLFAVSVSIAEDNISIEPLVGTWVNGDCDKIYKYGKLIVKPDSTLEAFDDPARTAVPKTLTLIVDESWSDTDGNIFYKFTQYCPVNLV